MSEHDHRRDDAGGEDDEYERSILDDIARVGWSLLAIEADEHGPAFVYSIGMMHTLNHPEIIMFGLDHNLMAHIINDMGDQIRGGRRFDEPGLFEDVLERFACKCVPVSEARHEDYLGYAMWHRRHVGKIGTLRAVQVLWPDKAGIFPDEPGCNPAIVKLQPLLQS